MITINLLPQELKAKKKFLELNQQFLPMIGLALAGVLVLILILWGSSFGLRYMQLNQLNKEMSELSSFQEEIELLNQKIALLGKKSQTAEQLFNRKIYWSKKIYQLSEMIEPGIWLTGLELQSQIVQSRSQKNEKKTLLIQGRIYSKSRDETAIVGKLISRMKEDIDFYSDFEDVRLKTVRSITLGDIPVSEFLLLCIVRSQGEKE